MPQLSGHTLLAADRATVSASITIGRRNHEREVARIRAARSGSEIGLLNGTTGVLGSRVSPLVSAFAVNEVTRPTAGEAAMIVPLTLDTVCLAVAPVTLNVDGGLVIVPPRLAAVR